MQLLPKVDTLCKGALLYRFIRYRKGFGVHSPFVFSLITKVIEEAYPYYSYYDIDLIRKELLFREGKITYADFRKGGERKTQTVAEIVKHWGIKQKHGELLFRLTNYFKPKNILQIGPTVGLSTLYLTTYAKGLKCISLERVPEFTSIIDTCQEKEGRNPIDVRTGSYTDTLPKALNDMPSLDFAYFNTSAEPENNRWLFNECLKQIHKDTVFVFEGIKVSPAMKELWQEVRECPEVSVTLDLYSLGIAIFNKRLHKRNYTVFFR